ncbi:hypothetical protein OY671_012618, partial [Metschnikowia pulcherrima]
PRPAARLGTRAETGRDPGAARAVGRERPGLHRHGPAGMAPGRGPLGRHPDARAGEPHQPPPGARMGSPQQGRAAHQRLPRPGLGQPGQRQWRLRHRRGAVFAADRLQSARLRRRRLRHRRCRGRTRQLPSAAHRRRMARPRPDGRGRS